MGSRGGEAGEATDPADRRALDAAMERYADGDDAAFSVLYDGLFPALHRFVSRQRFRAASADDVVQQTFLQLHLNRHRFVRGAAVLPWAYAIARNLLRDGSRHQRHVDQLEQVAAAGELDGAPESPPDEALDLRRRQAALLEAVSRLAPRLQEAFVLVKLEGLGTEEAAQVLGITRGNLKIRIHRAKEALRSAAPSLFGLAGEEP